MALELETTIMQEIGLGMNYQWFNSSGSCQYIRQDASRKLEGAIRKHHDAGEKIIAPDSELISLMHEATYWDENQYVLTVAWQVASYIIAAHIHAAYQPEEEQRQFLADQAQQIRQHYQSEHQIRGFHEDNPWFQMLKHMDY